MNFDTFCSIDCSFVEDRGHLFINCDLYGRLRLVISGWLGISTVFYGTLIDHSIRFSGLWRFSKKSHLTFNIIWISVLFTIWKTRNERDFL